MKNIKEIFKTKPENELDDFLMDDSQEREILSNVGKYSVYAPNAETREILAKLIEDGIEGENPQTLQVEDSRLMVELFANLTNLDDSYLMVDKFEKILSNPKKQKMVFKKLKSKVEEIAKDEIIELVKSLQAVNEMPEEMRKNYFKKLKEFNEAMELQK